MARDFGGHLTVDICEGVPAAVCVVLRKGLGRRCRLDTQALWVQDAVREKKVDLIKVRGTQTPAGMIAKHLGTRALCDMIDRLCVDTRG